MLSNCKNFFDVLRCLKWSVKSRLPLFDIAFSVLKGELGNYLFLKEKPLYLML